MFEKFLQDLGLSDKEAKVYLYLLTVDNDSVIDIANKTGVNRTTVYPILEVLAKKGLVSEVKIDKKVRYQAESPERLTTFIERQRVLFDEQAKKALDVIPQLKSIQREIGERPVVKYFEGREGVVSSIEDFFKSQKTGGIQHMIYSRDLVEEIFTEKEREKFKKARQNKKIIAKAVYTNSKGDLPVQVDSYRIRIDEKKYPINCDISIYNDNIKISILGKKISGISIVSNDLANTMRSLIDFIFDNIKK